MAGAGSTARSQEAPGRTRARLIGKSGPLGERAVCVARAAEVRHGADGAETAGQRYLYPLSVKSVDSCETGFGKAPPQIENARVPEFSSENNGLRIPSLTRGIG